MVERRSEFGCGSAVCLLCLGVQRGKLKKIGIKKCTVFVTLGVQEGKLTKKEYKKELRENKREKKVQCLLLWVFRGEK